jgi:hypothetical protein
LVVGLLIRVPTLWCTGVGYPKLCVMLVRGRFSGKLIGSVCGVTGTGCVGTVVAVIGKIKSQLNRFL